MKLLPALLVFLGAASAATTNVLDGSSGRVNELKERVNNGIHFGVAVTSSGGEADLTSTVTVIPIGASTTSPGTSTPGFVVTPNGFPNQVLTTVVSETVITLPQYTLTSVSVQTVSSSDVGIMTMTPPR